MLASTSRIERCTMSKNSKSTSSITIVAIRLELTASRMNFVEEAPSCLDLDHPSRCGGFTKKVAKVLLRWRLVDLVVRQVVN
ncbi:hypothetical protein Syun_027693 [Stephania yunnanensis]|uniref:Uncharacterized protein n=1 Tax=Stephania yunnanensis TaxID=152371 RepID=A0AAP0EJD6_9MAGN